MNITTSYKVNAKGTGQILARGNGKQRTVNYDHARTPHQNHGDGAGTLALVLCASPLSRKIAAETAKVTNNHDGTLTFSLGQ